MTLVDMCPKGRVKYQRGMDGCVTRISQQRAMEKGFEGKDFPRGNVKMRRNRGRREAGKQLFDSVRRKIQKLETNSQHISEIRRKKKG